jgi:cytochrome c5
MKRAVAIVLIATISLPVTMGERAMADEKAALPTPEQVEKMSGKELYKLSCKPCHAPKSPAGEYTPMTLIQEQWDRFFDQTYDKVHAPLADTAKPTPEWITPDMVERFRLITPKALEKIRKFAIDGAADSEHPMTCG